MKAVNNEILKVAEEIISKLPQQIQAKFLAVKTAIVQTAMEGSDENISADSFDAPNYKQSRKPSKSTQTDIDDQLFQHEVQATAEMQFQSTQTDGDPLLQIHQILNAILDNAGIAPEPKPAGALVKISEILDFQRKETKRLKKLISENEKEKQHFASAKQYINQLLAQLDGQSLIIQQNEQLESKISQLESQIADLQIKEEETDTLFTKCQTAYHSSLTQLKQQADKQVERLQEQLAAVFDNLRKVRRIESLDESVRSLFESLGEDIK